MEKKQPPKPISCYICFGEDSLLESSSVSECSCRFFVHEKCWNEAKRTQVHKDQCPFCNKKRTVPVLPPRRDLNPAPVSLFITIPDSIPTSSYQQLPSRPLAARPAPVTRPSQGFQHTPFQKKMLIVALISGTLAIIMMFVYWAL